MRKYTKILGVLIILTIMLSLLKSFASDRLSTSGMTLSETQSQVNFYKKENSLLYDKILSASSLTNISSEAAQIGFVEGKQNLVLGNSLPIAIKQ
jgi:hypothetical protein